VTKIKQIYSSVKITLCIGKKKSLEGRLFINSSYEYVNFNL